MPVYPFPGALQPFPPQADLQKLYADREKWAQMSLKNIANSGIFSADRAVLDYARDIWHASAVK